MSGTLGVPDSAAVLPSWRLLPFLRLMRPPNLPTAAADIVAGFALAGGGASATLGVLALSSVCLYAGGVVLNDAADAELDRIERPERPIPRGLVSQAEAYLFAAALLGCGIALAGTLGIESLSIALGIALLAACYDLLGKRLPFEGFYLMAGCRALNLLLGMSAVPGAVLPNAGYCLVPLIYVSALSLVSQQEVRGGGSLRASIAAAVVAAIGLGLWLRAAYPPAALPFAALFVAYVAPGFARAGRSSHAANVRAAVKRAVIGIALLDASLCAASGDPAFALLAASFMPLSFLLAKRFQVT